MIPGVPSNAHVGHVVRQRFPRDKYTKHRQIRLIQKSRMVREQFSGIRLDLVIATSNKNVDNSYRQTSDRERKDILRI